MATTTNYSWTTPDDTDLVKDGAAAIRTLGSSIDTTTKALNPSTTLGDIEYRSSTANTNTRLGIGSTGNVLTVAGGVPTWAAPGGSSTFAVFRDERTTDSGTFTSGAWRTRNLNTSQFNNITSASLSSNQISLPAGTYLVEGSAPVWVVGTHQTRFENITDSATEVLGQSIYADPSGNNANPSIISGIFTIAGTKTFEFQHRCSNTSADVGFGIGGNWGTQIYASITITKVG
jgi:hypothetical protein